MGGKATYHRDLMEGVIVMAAISSQGEYKTLPDLDKKIKAVLKRSNQIHTIVVAKNQNEKKPENRDYTLIKASGYQDLIKQLEENGGLLGEALRIEAQEKFTTLLSLPDNQESRANWQKLYQIPRLKKVEVIADGLPRSDDEDRRKEQRMSVSGWEEALGAEHFREIESNINAETFSGNILNVATINGVILGPPGSGKSSFLGWLTSDLATLKPERNLRPFPLFIRLAEWEENGKKLTLEDYLVKITKKYIPKQKKRRKILLDWLNKGRLILLFDGLDEVGNNFFNYFAKNIKKLKQDNQRFMVSCRTVSRGRYEALNLSIYYIDALTPEQRERYIEAFPWKAKYAERCNKLKEHFPQAPNIAALSTNPLMLSFLCHTLNSNDEISLPMVRVELIGKVLRNMLEVEPLGRERPNTLDITLAELPQKNFRPQTIITWLGKIAFALFESDGQSALVFDADRFEKICRQKAGLDNTLLGLFLAEMQWRGIIRPHPGGYMFFHLIIQEYLVALELARRIEKNALDAEEIIGDETKPLGEWLYDWSIEPRWEEVMLLTAGVLEEPAGYLTHIYEPSRDTLFRHRLSMAARMTGEIPQPFYQYPSLRTTAKEILNTTRNIWIASDNREVQKVILKQINKAAMMLFQRPDKEMRIDKVFNAALIHRNKIRNLQTAEIIQLLFPIFSASEITIKLIGSLQNGDDKERRSVVYTLGGIGVVTPKPEIIGALAEILSNENLCYSATEALGKIGTAAATLSVATKLIKMLRNNHDVFLRYMAGDTFSQMGVAVVTPEIITELTDMLRDEEENVRLSAIQIFLKMGTVVARPEIITELTDMLQDENPSICGNAARSLGEILDIRTRPKIIEKLIGMLSSEDIYIRYSATLSLGKIGAAATPEIVAELTKMLKDEDPDVSYEAASSLREIENIEIRSKVITTLVEMIRENGPFGSGAAAETLNDMEVLVTRPEIIVELVKMLQDKSSERRYAIASSLGKLGAAVATPEIIIELTKMLRDVESGVRYIAFIILGKMGVNVSAPEIIAERIEGVHNERFGLLTTFEVFDQMSTVSLDSDQLVIMFDSIMFQDDFMGKPYNIINGLSTFGLAANRPPITTFLEECANSPDQPEEVRQAAKDALIKIRGA